MKQFQTRFRVIQDRTIYGYTWSFLIHGTNEDPYYKVCTVNPVKSQEDIGTKRHMYKIVNGSTHFIKFINT